MHSGFSLVRLREEQLLDRRIQGDLFPKKELPACISDQDHFSFRAIPVLVFAQVK